jgi:hypothetical protein
MQDSYIYLIILCVLKITNAPVAILSANSNHDTCFMIVAGG